MNVLCVCAGAMVGSCLQRDSRQPIYFGVHSSFTWPTFRTHAHMPRPPTHKGSRRPNHLNPRRIHNVFCRFPFDFFVRGGGHAHKFASGVSSSNFFSAPQACTQVPRTGDWFVPSSPRFCGWVHAKRVHVLFVRVPFCFWWGFQLCR